MTSVRPHTILGYLHRLGGGLFDNSSDGELVRRFARTREEAAFAALVRRHGDLVWGVCRRRLRNAQDAEDVFQATFLVLARKAGSVRRPDAIANWLYGVAYRLALKVNAALLRRGLAEERLRVSWRETQASQTALHDVCVLLDDELHRLPQCYQEPLLLCYLEGETRDRAARRLGWSLRTLDRRLAQGRELLHKRLLRRGVTLSAAFLAPFLSTEGSSGAMPACLAATTIRAAVAFALTRAAADGSARVIALAEAVLKGMSLATFKSMTSLAIALGIVIAGTGLIARHALLAQGEHAPGVGFAVLAADDTDETLHAQANQGGIDRYGDPLPPGALLRLGTLRHRYLYRMQSHNQPLPDGQTVLTNTDKEVRWVDQRAGKLIDSWPLPRGQLVCGFSEDGRMVLLSDGQRLHLYDLKTREKLRLFEDRGEIGSRVEAHFSPDGRTVATALCVNFIPGLIRVWDVGSGKQLWQEGEIGSPRGRKILGFLEDGKTLALMDESDHRVSVRDRATGVERRAFSIATENLQIVFGLSPDGKTLFASASKTTVHAWDMASGKELAPFGGHEKMVHALAISRDGSTIVTGGADPFLLVWNWPECTVRRKIDLPTRHGVRELHISSDGKRVAVLFPETVQHTFELDSGREIATPLEAHRFFAGSLATAGGGELISGAQDNSVRLWDLRSGRQLREIQTSHPVGPMTLSLSTDGRLIATGDINSGTVELHERATGRLVSTIKSGGKSIRALAFIPGTCFLAISVRTTQFGAGGGKGNWFVALWNTEHNNEVRRLELVAEKLAVDPSGRFCAATGLGQTRILEVSSGRELLVLPEDVFTSGLVFSPDGRTLAWCGTKAMILLEVASGKERFRCEPSGEWPRTAQFSPDGRWLARANQRAVEMFDLLRGKITHSFVGPDNMVGALAFTPDGRKLASAIMDTTILVWDLAGVIGPRSGLEPEPDSDAVLASWRDLASADAKLAYRAIWVLVQAPKQSLPLLRQHLRAVPSRDPQRIKRLLADLDSNRFAEREKATRELEQDGDADEGALQSFLAGISSTEPRRRAQMLLDKLGIPITDPEQLRALRAVEVLEHTGTADARQLLEKIAQGAPEARLTLDAKASLIRLSHLSRGGK